MGLQIEMKAFFSKIYRLLKYVIFSKWVWQKPLSAEVLIFDRTSSYVFFEYLKNDDLHVLDTRGESLNIYVIFKCLISGKVSKSFYFQRYIEFVNPKIVLTFINNNKNFYGLNKLNSTFSMVFVQNGLRSELAFLFKPQSFQVDYMLVFGKSIGHKYSQYINGQVLPVGSFKNNLIPSGYQNKEASKSFLFLSQFRYRKNKNSPILIAGNVSFNWHQFYAAEFFILPLLQQYCAEKDLRLKICMCSKDEFNQESDFYHDILGKDIELLKKDSLYSGYHNLFHAEYKVFIDSTLGYESLARGMKTVAFSIRGSSIGLPSSRFGWPAELADSGPFWANQPDENEFRRVMDYITTVDDNEWEKTRQHYMSDIMEYDPGNTKFIKLMRELDVPLKPHYTS